MKTLMLTLLALASLTSVQADQISDEARYLEFSHALYNNKAALPVALGPTDAKLLVDALWDAQEEGRVPMRLRTSLRRLERSELSVQDQLRVAILRHRVGMSYSRRQLGTALIMGLADKRDGESLAFHIVALRRDLEHMGMAHIVNSAQVMQPKASAESLNTEGEGSIDRTEIAVELWENDVNLETWNNGKYAGGVVMYQFCRSKRNHPCLHVLRDSTGQPYRTSDGKLWGQPALSLSARGLPSNQRNGNTPAGIHTINGVMPAADQVPSFGKFRRIILDFVPKTSNEERQREILPGLSQNSDWWRPNVVARDMGRNLFRIHGAGKLSEDPSAPWFPFRPTSGCVAKRENKYGDVEYRDQQDMLDTLMAAQGLEVKYENETKIKGLLFIIELNDEDAPVTLDTLTELGIK